ncbi:phospholipase A2-alpha-like [Andrographis paniculata]|uniref:phospholipase A2-alpha-like n=1 Tax=Andrographis paniculata TaxID=175694 RepID=UPI0021E913F1|nr:phospholipase A2-alpha-like [Andrographis paniculata]
MASPTQLLNFSFIVTALVLGFCGAPISALNVGIRAHDDNLDFTSKCSSYCESMFCDAAPFLRYGKYCGLMYTGCPGEEPCDELDDCCMKHDDCITNMGNEYLSQKCNKALLQCLAAFRKSHANPFKGNSCNINDVVRVINETISAAVTAGIILGKP